MSYATIEAAVVAVIQKHADFAGSATKANDTKALGKGVSRFCLVSYNSDKAEELSIKTDRRTWLLNIDVFVPWRGDMADLESRIGTEVQKVKDTLAAWPRLDNCAGVLKAGLTIGTFPDVLTRGKGSFRGKRSMLEVQEAYTTARSE
ncbi:MAG: hypothetical protein M0R06_12460 [Sphaerochaeta sp.]|jgi:hypothetical protein|nr:hypothetical protein [Sphaerochaeta sp.]